MDNRESCGEGPLPDPPAPEMRHAAIWALQWHSRRLISVAVFCLPDRVDGKMNLFPRLLREGVAGRQSHYLHIHFLIRWCADSGVTAMFIFFPAFFILHFAAHLRRCLTFCHLIFLTNSEKKTTRYVERDEVSAGKKMIFPDVTGKNLTQLRLCIGYHEAKGEVTFSRSVVI